MQPELLIVLENHQQFQKVNLVRILRQSVRLLTNEISKNLVKNGHANLTARHLNVFENLQSKDNNIVTLANRAGISKQAMSKLVKEITQEGYVVVITDKRDNRVQLVQLTEKGVDFVTSFQTELMRKCDEILDLGLIKTDDAQIVYQTLTSFIGYLESKPELKIKEDKFSDALIQ